MKRIIYLFFIAIVLINTGFGVAENSVYHPTEQTLNVKNDVDHHMVQSDSTATNDIDESENVETKKSLSIAEIIGSHIISAIRCTIESIISFFFGLVK